MKFEDFSFDPIRIEGITYEHDVVIDPRKVRKRNKKASKQFRDAFGIRRSQLRRACRGTAAAWRSAQGYMARYQ